MNKLIFDVEGEVAPCLLDGPFAENGRALVSAATGLGQFPFASVLRTWCVPLLFSAMEAIFASETDPHPGLNEALTRLTDFLNAAASTSFNKIEFEASTPSSANGSSANGYSKENIKNVTGDHYGHLFQAFSAQSFWDEPKALLYQRLQRNGISLCDIENKSVLDAGCGGGRYTAAWRLLGAASATGLDISTINIADAERRVSEAGIDKVDFRLGDVLDMPFETDTFDIVFSNGVLHHTTNWEKGVVELLRVLKPGGLGWLYLIESPGGVFWDVIEILRAVMKDERKSDARFALQLLNIPGNRIFYMLDHVMVPINIRLSPEVIEQALLKAGATRLRRLERGSDFDRVEQIYRKRKFAEAFFGVGENRYIFSK